MPVSGSCKARASTTTRLTRASGTFLHAVVDVEQAPHRDVLGEPREVARASCGAAAAAITNGSDQPACQASGGRRHQPACGFVDELGEPAHTGCHDRRAARHRLDRREPERFLPKARYDGGAAALPDRGQLVEGNRAEITDAIVALD